MMPWLGSAGLESRSPSVPLSITAGRQLAPRPAMLRSESCQAAPPVAPAANAFPPGGGAEFSPTAGDDAPGAGVPGAAPVRAAAGRAAGLPVWVDTARATAAAPAISPDAAAAQAQRRARIPRPRCSTVPTGG